MRIKAAVLRSAAAPYSVEELELAGPGPGQLLVRVAGVGMCHTDAVWRLPGFGDLPVVPGHEGAGVVEAVGPGVVGARVGDAVVMTFDSCGACTNCLDARPATCHDFWKRNLTGRNTDGSTPARDPAGQPVAVRWFQQSSFASHALVTERNVVKVSHSLPLHLMGPLGCSVQTGAGAVLNSLRVSPCSALLVVGAGGVGLAAVMAARVVGAGPIIAVDRLESRLDLARELGATHTLKSNIGGLVERVQKIHRPGVDRALDTTGAPDLISASLGAIRPGGLLGLVGRQTGDLVLSPERLALGRKVVFIMEGDAVPQRFIPLLIDLWQDGRLPFDRLITTYPLSDINRAERAVHDGDAVKAVLLPG